MVTTSITGFPKSFLSPLLYETQVTEMNDLRVIKQKTKDDVLLIGKFEWNFVFWPDCCLFPKISCQQRQRLPLLCEAEWGHPWVILPSQGTTVTRCCYCLVAKLSLTLCNPMDYSPPGSSVHGVFQARMLEWVAISSFKVSSRPRDQTSISCSGRQMFYHWATREAGWLYE